MKINKELSERVRQTVDKLSHPDGSRMFYNPKHNIQIPSVDVTKQMIKLLREVLFPGYFGKSLHTDFTLSHYTGVNIDQIFLLLTQQIQRGICFECQQRTGKECEDCSIEAATTATKFIESLPEIRHRLSTDVVAMFNSDPAAESKGEIIFSYPAIRALTNYRIAHELIKLNVPFIPRIITELAHFETGIDIHPGATIGDYFSIDHGTGVVIGATSIIGNNVKLYQGVTLGAKSFPLDENGNPIKGIARHPIVEDNVVCYAHATILGRVTIGKGSIIGGNVWVTGNVPPNSRLIQSKPRSLYYADGGGI